MNFWAFCSLLLVGQVSTGLAFHLSPLASSTPVSARLDSEIRVESSRTRVLFASNNGEEPTSVKDKALGDIPPRRLSTNNEPEYLSQDASGFTVKQRLREEVESPFRKVRLLFFGSSAGSALTALYFSALNTIKAIQGGYADAQPLDEALTNDAINLGGAIVCALLALREYKAGQANLERIAQGGRLAALNLELASTGARKLIKDYRRFSRVVIAAGGEDYIARLCRSLTADQLQDSNILPEKLQNTDVLVVPVLLSSSAGNLADTKEHWMAVEPSDGDRNMDVSRANNILAFPLGTTGWETYLAPEIKTAQGQGFDVMEKGFTIIVKKNGRILRRATGLPPWGDMIATMEVADGSNFGMPGDTERYGGR